MAFKRIVDLSHKIIPGDAGRRFNIEQVDADTVAPVKLLPGQWYIMHNVVMVNHLGTHMEVPYHLRPEGQDLTEFPIENTLGPTRILDIGHPPADHSVTLEEIKKATFVAGGVEPGAITFDLCRALVDEYVTVTEDEIAEALREYMGIHHMMIEGSAAVAIAAFDKLRAGLAGKNVVIVLCGANISPEIVKDLLS